MWLTICRGMCRGHRQCILGSRHRWRPGCDNSWYHRLSKDVEYYVWGVEEPGAGVACGAIPTRYSWLTAKHNARLAPRLVQGETHQGSVGILTTSHVLLCWSWLGKVIIWGLYFTCVHWWSCAHNNCETLQIGTSNHIVVGWIPANGLMRLFWDNICQLCNSHPLKILVEHPGWETRPYSWPIVKRKCCYSILKTAGCHPKLRRTLSWRCLMKQ